MPRAYVNDELLDLFPDPQMPPGGEGTVFPHPSNPGALIKIAHKPDQAYSDKLRVMLDNPLNAADIAWPTDLVYAIDRTTIIGCQIPRAVQTKQLKSLYSGIPSNGILGFTYAVRIDIALNLARAVARAHGHECVVGDLSPTNVFVELNGSVCLIDVNSFQIRRAGKTYRCNVGNLNYTSPELHTLKNFSDIDRTVHHDAFGLGTLIFEILVGPGHSPFAARHVGSGSPLQQTERIRLGIWPYATKQHADYVPKTAAPLDLIHPHLQPLVVACFDTGHAKPALRPLPADWLAALEAVRQDTDFLQNTAPQLETEALAAHRKAVNTPLKKQPPRGASSRFSRIVGPLKRLPRPSRRVVVATAAASLCFSLGYVARAVFVPQSANIGLTERTDMPRALPEIYQKMTDKSVAAPFLCPASGKSLPTPSLYQDIVNDNP